MQRKVRAQPRTLLRLLRLWLLSTLGPVLKTSVDMLVWALASGEEGAVFYTPFLLIYGAPCWLIGFAGILSALKQVYLVPEGIAVTLGGRTIARYPVEEIGMFCAVEWWEKRQVRALGVSIHSPDELTALRERQLEKGVFTRDEVKFRRRRDGWQKEFRQEYLQKRARFSLLMPWKWDILWLPLDPDLPALLQVLYPRVPWEFLQSREDMVGRTILWKDKDPLCVPRMRGATRNSRTVILVGACVILPGMLLAALTVDGLGLMTLPFVGFSLLFGLVLYGSRGEADMFHFSQSGIRITRGERELAAIFAKEIRTILKCESDAAVADYGSLHLLISTETREELVQRGLDAVQRPYVQVFREIPDWKTRVLFRYCSRLRGLSAATAPGCQMISWNEQREQTLRTLYPEAEWIDLTGEAIFSRNLHQIS